MLAHPPDQRFPSPVFMASLAGLWVRLLRDQPLSQCVNTSFGAINGFRHPLRISEHLTSDKGKLFYEYRENKYSWILSTFLNGTGQHGGARRSLLHTEKDTQDSELVQTPEIYVQAGYIIIQNLRSFLELQFLTSFIEPMSFHKEMMAERASDIRTSHMLTFLKGVHKNEWLPGVVTRGFDSSTWGGGRGRRIPVWVQGQWTLQRERPCLQNKTKWPKYMLGHSALLNL